MGGAAFEVGCLLALETDLGWDARRAEVVVGTSAGSLVGTALRLGISPSDLAALLAQVPRHATHPLVTGEHMVVPPAPAPQLLRLLLGSRPPSLGLVARLVRRPGTASLVAVLAGMLPAGRTGLAPHMEFLQGRLAGGWPQERLQLVATRRRDGERVVFDAAAQVPLAEAVAASCSLPGVYAPVEIDGDLYVDGGIGSSTNADLLVGEDLDLVLVVAPLAAERVAVTGVVGAMARWGRARLTQEVEMLRTAGHQVAVLTPAGNVVGGLAEPVQLADLPGVIGSAFLRTGRLLASAEAGPLQALRTGRRAS